jgi:hypothetical protein
MIEGSGSVYLCLTIPDPDQGGQKAYDPTDPDSLHCKKTHLLLAGVGHEVEQGHVLVAAGLGVGDAREAVELEPERVAALAPVHVVPEREDDLQHLAQSLAALNLLARLQHPRHLHQGECEDSTLIKRLCYTVKKVTADIPVLSQGRA